VPSISFGHFGDWEAELAEKSKLQLELLDCRQKLADKSKVCFPVIRIFQTFPASIH
jgi:hypothetical protein